MRHCMIDQHHRTLPYAGRAAPTLCIISLQSANVYTIVMVLAALLKLKASSISVCLRLRTNPFWPEEARICNLPWSTSLLRCQRESPERKPLPVYIFSGLIRTGIGLDIPKWM